MSTSCSTRWSVRPGWDATLAALGAGKRVALANKETLVVAGELAAAAAARGGGEIVPVDSEHSAILQCIGARSPSDIRRLIITASGGPFRTWTADEISGARLEEALRHPTGTMGKKITVDSATLANKALEVIEAHFLFGVPYDRIEVVVHPQSIVHSMVEFVDGSILAQPRHSIDGAAGAVLGVDASRTSCRSTGTCLIRPPWRRPR